MSRQPENQFGINLGMTLRAIRLGFAWTGGSFLRIQGNGPFKLEFYPAQLIPNSARTHEHHWVWWSADSNIPRDAWFFNVKAKRHFISYIDDEGNIV